MTGPLAVQLPSPLASVAPAWAPGQPLPPETTWSSYNPLTAESTRNESERAAAGDVYVVPIPEACPPGTMDYPVARFNCITTYREDGNRGPDPTIGLRRVDPDIEPGFGLEKIKKKHGVNQRTIGYAIVNNRGGQTQPNGNELYGIRAMLGDVELLAIEVVVRQAPSDEPTAPDRFNLGVVTAYCKGFDGQCPAGVNESVARGQP